MTNQERVTKELKKMTDKSKTPNKILTYNSETKRLEVMDTSEADKKDLLKVTPEDMIVSGNFCSRES